MSSGSDLSYISDGDGWISFDQSTADAIDDESIKTSIDIEVAALLSAPLKPQLLAAVELAYLGSGWTPKP